MSSVRKLRERRLAGILKLTMVLALLGAFLLAVSPAGPWYSATVSVVTRIGEQKVETVVYNGTSHGLVLTVGAVGGTPVTLAIVLLLGFALLCWILIGMVPERREPELRALTLLTVGLLGLLIVAYTVGAVHHSVVEQYVKPTKRMLQTNQQIRFKWYPGWGAVVGLLGGILLLIAGLLEHEATTLLLERVAKPPRRYRHCVQCGRRIATHVRFCPYCGAEQPAEVPPKEKVVKKEKKEVEEKPPRSRRSARHPREEEVEEKAEEE